MVSNMILIGLLVLMVIVFLIIRLNKIKASVKHDKVDNNLVIRENKTEYNLDYTDLDYYNNTIEPAPIDNFIQDMIIPVVIVDIAPTTPRIDDIPNGFVRELHGGSQNVHDSFIQEKVKEINKKIPQTLGDSTGEITRYFPETEKIIDEINKRNSFISNINKREMDVLRHTWNIAKTDENMRNEFGYQLNSCMENGGLVCGTGVVTRLTSSLCINDIDNIPKTKEMINREVMDKFSNLYSGNEEEKPEIKKKIMSEYKEESMRKKVGALIDEWIDFV